MQKRPANNRCKVILLDGNARLHVVKSVKQTLLELEWELSLFSKLKCEIRFCSSVNSPSVSIPLSRGAIQKDYQFSFFEIFAIAGFKETGRACQTLGHHSAISDCSFNRSSGTFTCRYGADLTNIVAST
ncbi:hypothetical protein ALC57_07297 [Trachymyrmex cornetzi]|uniref:Uncharacterized protein n=1 Tax=Trachymyrmex cornetzi TaxID=471704 RepID=A0A195E688_9HYME|nr:hypothetical protein ALC57_07297 [Trachymyrmex cornetzi]